MLHYSDTGKPGAPALLFLHGFLGSGADWSEIIDKLSPAYRCLAVDLPGHGASCALEGEGAYTMEGTAMALNAVLDGLSVSRCGVVGYSMGGRVALYFGLHYPERCTKLVLESASPGLQQAVEREERRGMDQAHALRLERDDFGRFLDDWYRQPLFSSLARRPDLLRQTLEARRRNDPGELARSLRGMGTGAQPPLWDRIQQLRLPTLFVAGAEDGKYVDVAQRMGVLSDFITTAIVPDAGHTIHAEYPDAFADLLLDFFRTP